MPPPVPAPTPFCHICLTHTSSVAPLCLFFAPLRLLPSPARRSGRNHESRVVLAAGSYRWSAPLVVGRMGVKERMHCSLNEERADEEGIAPAASNNESADWAEGVCDAADPQLWDDPWLQPMPPAHVGISKVLQQLR